MTTFTQWLGKTRGKYPQNMGKYELDAHVKQYCFTSREARVHDIRMQLKASLDSRLADESLGTEAKKELQDFYAHIEDQFS